MLYIFFILLLYIPFVLSAFQKIFCPWVVSLCGKINFLPITVSGAIISTRFTLEWHAPATNNVSSSLLFFYYLILSHEYPSSCLFSFSFSTIYKYLVHLFLFLHAATTLAPPFKPLPPPPRLFHPLFLLFHLVFHLPFHRSTVPLSIISHSLCSFYSFFCFPQNLATPCPPPFPLSQSARPPSPLPIFLFSSS